MLDRDTLDLWYSGELIDTVRYRLNDSVALLDQPHVFAAIVSLEAIVPEPQYLIEFSTGSDQIVRQSELATVIYVALVHEGTTVWRPVAARPLGSELFRIVSENPEPNDEQWEFVSGSTVRCERRDFGGHSELVATSAAAV